MGFIVSALKKVKLVIAIIVVIIIVLIAIKVLKLKTTIKDMLEKEGEIANKIVKKGMMGTFVDLMTDSKSESETEDSPKEKPNKSANPKKKKKLLDSDEDFSATTTSVSEVKLPKVKRKLVKNKSKNISQPAVHNSEPLREVKPKGRDLVRRSNSKVSKYKGEELCRKFFEDYFDDYFPTVRPKFLTNPKTGYPLELDGYNAGLSLAFERQGLQHRVFPNPFHKTREEFDKQLERDAYKKQRCAELGINLIEIPDYILPDQIPAFCTEELVRLGYAKANKSPPALLDLSHVFQH